jgi:hypothetical protein
MANRGFGTPHLTEPGIEVDKHRHDSEDCCVSQGLESAPRNPIRTASPDGQQDHVCQCTDKFCYSECAIYHSRSDRVSTTTCDRTARSVGARRRRRRSSARGSSRSKTTHPRRSRQRRLRAIIQVDQRMGLGQYSFH